MYVKTHSIVYQKKNQKQISLRSIQFKKDSLNIDIAVMRRFRMYFRLSDKKNYIM